MTTHQPPWSDESWLEPSDNAWQRRLRRHQGWWRATHTRLPAGPRSSSDRRLVVSMLPDSETLEPNLMTAESRAAAEDAIARLARSGGPGLIARDRLARNLLSSQPLCFNLFGHHRTDPDALLPWVREIRPQAREVTRVEVEIAPVETPLSRSAFDAYVEYMLADGDRGFFGIECKYAENLTASQRDPASEKFKDATTSADWKDGAAAALDRHGLRQFWYNALLMFLTCEEGGFAEGTSVVVALGVDDKASRATAAVADQVLDPTSMRFSSLESVVECVNGHDEWKRDFRTRYLDFDLSEGD